MMRIGRLDASESKNAGHARSSGSYSLSDMETDRPVFRYPNVWSVIFKIKTVENAMAQTAPEKEEQAMVWSEFKKADEQESIEILFLDIDGVMNGSEEIYASTDEDEPENKEDSPLFAEHRVKRLKSILDKTQCRLVLSTSWRRNKESVSAIASAFKKMTLLGPRYISATLRYWIIINVSKDCVSGHMKSIFICRELRRLIAWKRGVLSMTCRWTRDRSPML